jgi:hypothetical protein
MLMVGGHSLFDFAIELFAYFGLLVHVAMVYIQIGIMIIEQWQSKDSK